MIAEIITNENFVNQIICLKQERFSGKLLVKSTLEQEWVFYLFLGRFLYATGGRHPIRRWQRNLTLHCPQVELYQLNLSKIISNSSAESFNISWEYKLFCLWVEQQKITREQVGKAIGAIVSEVLLDITQAMQVTSQVNPEKSSVPQLVLLDPGQVIIEVLQVWQTWQKAKIADRSPNRALVIKQPEELQQRVSVAVYQNLTKLLDGQRTLRDLAVVMKRDVLEVTCSLLPFMQSGLVKLIDIPDLTVPTAPRTPVISPPPPAVSQGPLIACVDDSPLVCQSMEKILTKANYQFLAIQDSLRAIATLLTRKPDLIFLDLVMPGTNGYEICGQLRKISTFRNIPIIILTGNDSIMDRVRAKMIGASDLLGKPVSAETVLQVVQHHLNNSLLVG